MKRSKKLICCVAIAVVLGVGVTVAAQAANAGKEQLVSDTVSEPSLSESSISETSEPETVDAAVSVSVPDDTDGSSVTSEETESAPVDAEEEEQQQESVKQYLPTANAPDDINYCDVNDFLPTGDWGGSVIINTGTSSEVYAVSSGEVIFADYDYSSCGNRIIIKYENGLYGSYSHLEFYNGILVEKGDIVEAGQHIGMTGTTGYVTEPCLGYICRDEIDWYFLPKYLESNESPLKAVAPDGSLVDFGGCIV